MKGRKKKEKSSGRWKEEKRKKKDQVDGRKEKERKMIREMKERKKKRKRPGKWKEEKKRKRSGKGNNLFTFFHLLYLFSSFHLPEEYITYISAEE